MYNPFARDRFGRPQIYALLLLSAFLAQALYAVQAQPLRDAELGYVQVGEQQWQDASFRRPHFIAPLIALMAALPVMAAGHSALEARRGGQPLRWPARLPFVAIGLLLGGSLWYVARRLYGNPGGYVALALYCFSSAPVFSARVGANVVAMFGLFGVVFLAIALAHTLYAPAPGDAQRPWLPGLKNRWRRLLLLTAAITLALGAAPGTLIGLVLALAFMLYLVPGRRLQALASFAAAAGMALFALFVLNGGSASALAQQLRLSAAPVSLPLAWLQVRFYAHSVLWLTHYPALLLFTLSALATYAVSRRARYFGNTAPLLVVAILWIVAAAGLATDILAYGAFPLRALPFVFVFIGGICADLLETPARRIVTAAIVALLLSHAVIAFRDLSRSRGDAHPFFQK